MDENTIRTLAGILNDNVGQRLTVAMANGIINTLAYSLAQAQAQENSETQQAEQ